MTNHRGISDDILEQLQQRATQEGRTVDDLLRDFLETPATPPQEVISYKTLLDNTTDNITVFDPDLRYIYVNPMLQSYIGREYDEIIGKTDRELGLSEENLQRWRSGWDEVIATQQDKTVRFEFPTPDGIRTFESRLTPIYDDDGTLVYLLAITRDVSEREQTQQMLQDITNHAPGMFLRYERLPDGTDVASFVSQRVEDVYEVSVEEALADVQSMWRKVHPDDIDAFARSIEVSLADLSPWDYEWRIRKHDGSYRWVEGRGTPYRLEDGRTVWNTLILDITQRKRLEQEQQSLVDQLQLALETAKLGLWRLNLETDELYWNERQMEIYGVDPATFVPHYETWRKRVHPDDFTAAQKRLRTAVTGETVFDVKFRIIRDDGETRYIQASADKLPTAPGEPDIMVGINMDVTERRHAKEVLLERERLMTNLQVEKERLATFQRIIAKLDHDMRNPLTVISTSHDLLTHYFDRIDANKRQERLDNIGKQLAYLKQLLNDLTRIQGISEDEPELHPTPQNLKMLCQITVQDIQETTGEAHQLFFEHDFAYDTVLIDSVLLNRILINLLSNAVKYSPAGTNIRLTLAAQDAQIVLRVSDQGIGMSQQELEHIFTPFYRAKASVQVDGSGLGLSIVQECVDRHNGQISVESIPGAGTTFTVRLPLALPT